MRKRNCAISDLRIGSFHVTHSDISKLIIECLLQIISIDFEVINVLNDMRIHSLWLLTQRTDLYSKSTFNESCDK